MPEIDLSPTQREYFLDRGWLAEYSDHVKARGEELFSRGEPVFLEVDTSTDDVVTVDAGFEDGWLTMAVRFNGPHGIVTTKCDVHGGPECEHAVAALCGVRECAAGAGIDGHVDAGLQARRDVKDERAPIHVQEWLDGLTKANPEAEVPSDPNLSASHPHQVLYVLHPWESANRTCFCRVSVMQGRENRTGGFSQYKRARIETTNWSPAKYFAEADIQLVRRMLLASRPGSSAEWTIGAGPEWAGILRGMLATGRCFWRNEGTRLSEGASRTAKPVWIADAEGRQKPGFDMDGNVDAYAPTHPLWYIDSETGTCGPLEVSMEPAMAVRWLNGPVLAPEDVAAVRKSLDSREFESLPKPESLTIEHITDCQAQPRLTLLKCAFETESGWFGWDMYDSLPKEINVARLVFDYAGHEVSARPPGEMLVVQNDQRILHIHRFPGEEVRLIQELYEWGFRCLAEMQVAVTPEHQSDFAPVSAFCDVSVDKWRDFVVRGVAKFRSEGWEIEVDPSFDFQVIEPESWYTELAERGGTASGWFDLEMGVELGGERLNLLPALRAFLRAHPDMTLDQLASLPEDDALTVPLEDGSRLVAVPAGRLHGILNALVELWDTARPGETALRLHKLRVAELAAVAGEEAAVQISHRQLARLGKKLADFQGVKPVDVPAGFKGDLRPYQQEGLNWLQFLRELQLGGILADDMGLGKTIQTLAHLQKEKQAGRAEFPVLIVAPTSVLANWIHEAKRFTPEIKCMILRGPQRRDRFPDIPEMDLIITSYPLLVRDGDELLKHRYHYVILDEAQFIKNPKAKAAITARQLQANHRLCLTGTPMENHLGELWSLFQFLVPGYLGDSHAFTKIYRNPIERLGDQRRRQHLFRRVVPMLLRRTKDAVLDDLPPKTEIMQRVSLTKAQADLYEAVRATMDQKIRDEIRTRGVDRSQIIILDAMLKLRQVCCHPRLLKIAAAQKVKESAKLAHLMEMLPELLEEGRRVLLFSQFTTMLGLIEEELRGNGLNYVKLTGATQDRETPVRDFQEGRVPLFLISLKAGGTGLNLTAADTVIHYDPWWNPAVENQATDRAHRIGQDKRVFVYKLIMERTIEEKIVALQVRKRDLVEGLLESGTNRPGLSEEDLCYLFAHDGPGDGCSGAG